MDWTESDKLTWVPRFEAFLAGSQTDGAHDLGHVRRVALAAERFARADGAELSVVMPAAWLHDCVAVPKDSPLRSQASRLAARAACDFLRQCGWDESLLDAIAHAIEAHSFSAGLEPTTLEASIVQDADRLEALGAIGLCRCIATGERMNRPLFHPDDPFWQAREPDDGRWSLDHLPVKLLRLEATMRTPAGRAEARRRTAFLEAFLEELRRELPDGVR